MKKTLVAYFSASGVTAKVAKNLAKAADADLYEIRPKTPYTAADLNWIDKQARSTIEMHNKSFRPELLDHDANISKYDVVYVGFPIWWYVAPTIINTFLESYQWNSKTIVPFCTAISSSIGNSSINLEPSAAGNPVWISGRRLERNISKREVENWISKLDIS